MVGREGTVSGVRVWPTERRRHVAPITRRNSPRQASLFITALKRQIRLVKEDPTVRHICALVQSDSARLSAFFVIEGCSVGGSLRNSRKVEGGTRVHKDPTRRYLHFTPPLPKEHGGSFDCEGRTRAERCDERSTRHARASFLRRRTRTLGRKRTGEEAGRSRKKNGVTAFSA